LKLWKLCKNCKLYIGVPKTLSWGLKCIPFPALLFKTKKNYFMSKRRKDSADRWRRMSEEGAGSRSSGSRSSSPP
jgi:hypothetical protein